MFETELATVSGDRCALADLASSIETDIRIAGCPTDPPVDDQDLAWWAEQRDRGSHDHHSDPADDPDAASDHDMRDPTDTAGSPAAATRADAGKPNDHDADDSEREETGGSTDGAHPATDSKITKRWPSAFRPPGWQPLTPTQLAAVAPSVVMNVHLTDQTLADNHGVVRTDTGPILLEQLKRYLIQHDASIKVYPVIDPAATASADSYEIPLVLRRAMAIRHPRSVFPHSATSSRLDLDHLPAYQPDGPPGQTSMATLGPLARNEHRAVTVGNWQRRQPEPAYLWRSPEHWIMITTNQGSLCLGHTEWAQQLWNVARPEP